jgi:hypothetical protein
MEQFNPFEDLKEQFHRFERAAAKRHEESIWIVSVVKGVDIEDRDAWKKAFAKTGEPLGWYFAGKFSGQGFDFYKKSAEGGCSWGQVEYGMYFRFGSKFVGKDWKGYVEWVKKSANQNNPEAMKLLGDLFGRVIGNMEKAVSYYRASAELGWKNSMDSLAILFEKGDGCAKDLRQAAIWSANGDWYVFLDLLIYAKRAWESRATEDLDCDFNQLCYSLGLGLYWYVYETRRWNNQSDKSKVFGHLCLDYYCSCVELQQRSIFTFLLCWKRTTGVKPMGQMIAEMVWKGREDNPVKKFEESDLEELETSK